MIEKPLPGEFPAYAAMYIDLLPDDGQLLKHLNSNFRMIRDFMLALPADRLEFRPAPGKWNIKEMLVHLIDDERIYAYRALRFARNDRTELPGFEQDDYAKTADANRRSLRSILTEYAAVRKATIQLFKNLPRKSFKRMGVANENPVSVRALAFHIAGHELHHFAQIRLHYP